MTDLIKCSHCGRDVNPNSTLCPFCGGKISGEIKLQGLLCPRCNVSLEINHKDDLELDLCPKCGGHGVWLDKGELEKIRHFIADGGLEHLQDKELEKNRQELNDLATTVKDTAFTHKLIHFWNWKRWFFS